MAKKVSKNDASMRSKVSIARKIGDKKVRPVLYIGKHRGHGKFIAAAYDGANATLAVDPTTGKPYSYCDGHLVRE